MHRWLFSRSIHRGWGPSHSRALSKLKVDPVHHLHEQGPPLNAPWHSPVTIKVSGEMLENCGLPKFPNEGRNRWWNSSLPSLCQYNLDHLWKSVFEDQGFKPDTEFMADYTAVIPALLFTFERRISSIGTSKHWRDTSKFLQSHWKSSVNDRMIPGKR